LGRAASRARARACLALRPPAAAGLRAGARLRARRAAAGRQGPLPGGSRSSAPLAVVLRPARLEQQGTSAAAAGMRAPPRHARAASACAPTTRSAPRWQSKRRSQIPGKGWQGLGFRPQRAGPARLHVHEQRGLQLGGGGELVEQLGVRLDLLGDRAGDLLRVTPVRRHRVDQDRPHHLRARAPLPPQPRPPHSRTGRQHGARSPLPPSRRAWRTKRYTKGWQQLREQSTLTAAHSLTPHQSCGRQSRHRIMLPRALTALAAFLRASAPRRAQNARWQARSVWIGLGFGQGQARAP